MSEGKRNNQKQRRRFARKAHRAHLNAGREQKESRSPRAEFSAKTRSGDLARVAFTFSGMPVPFDERDPSRALREKIATVAHLASQSKGKTH